ncbi:MAG TPA: TMEM165/GDT1 family protein [Myxococcaceae bacterium]|nr:TMEM165/GDT1 family protein [Myxococcaceae bacterium]
MSHPLVASFVLVALSEMGDKTQLLAFALAARFRRPWVVMAGVLVATVANHSLASTVGAWVAGLVPHRALGVALGLLFIGFGLWTLHPDSLRERKGPPRFGPFLTTVVAFFLAEMGDKTQLATAALAARFGAPVLVTLGTTAGMMVSDGLAVFAGQRLSPYVHHPAVRWTAAALFILFGLAGAWSALRAG